MSQPEKENSGRMTPRQLLGWSAFEFVAHIVGMIIVAAMPFAWFMLGWTAGMLFILFVLMVIYWPRRSRA